MFLINSKYYIFSAFYDLDKDILLKALENLESQGKAVLIDIDGEKGGVKFLWKMVTEKGLFRIFCEFYA